MKSFNKLWRQTFARNLLLKEQDYVQILDIKILESVVYQGRGRPKHDSQGEKNYQVTG